VPRDHPLIVTSILEAETLGLLDRLLSVYQEATRYAHCFSKNAQPTTDSLPISDALIVTATMNSIALLVRTRPSISQRILNVILNFNPFRVIGSTVTPRDKVNAKSMDKTLRAFLFNLLKRYG